MNQVVIAGGRGYLGRSIAEAWSSLGKEVVVLTRGEGAAFPSRPGLVFRTWDPSPSAAGEDLAVLMEGAFLVVNLAGERVAGLGPRYRWSEKRKSLLVASRREAGQALVAAIRKTARPPSVFVQASGIDYYAPGEEGRDEGSPPGSSFLSRLVAQEWEPSTAPVEALGVRRIILRLGPVLGPGSPVLAPLVLQHRLFAGGPLGRGRQWFPWIALGDLVGALVHLVGLPESKGPYNLVAPGLVRNEELSRILGRLLGRPSWLRTPAFALRLALGEMAGTLREGVGAEPARLLGSGYSFSRPNLEGALVEALARGS